MSPSQHHARKNPLAHLSAAQLDAFGREADAIKEAVLANRGEADARYIRGVIKLQRSMAVVSRLAIYASLLLLPGVLPQITSWWAFLTVTVSAAFLLGCAKSVENMELGHNILHGQFDWMRDPHINSTSWEWDTVSVADHWKQTHNVDHHTWTNVIGKDDDIGYGVMRMIPEQPWHPRNLLQPLHNVMLCLLFEYGNSLQILEIPKILSGDKRWADCLVHRRQIRRKWVRQILKDYVGYPLLAGPFFLYVLAANMLANMVRNVWSNMIIFCGHFPKDVHHFSLAECLDESRGHWYARQMLGACNITGSRLFHLMSGNLSFQIEHHMYPDLPCNRYREIAPQIRALADRYGLPYNSASFLRQYGTTTLRIWRMALP